MTLRPTSPRRLIGLVLLAMWLPGCQSPNASPNSAGHAAADSAEFTPEAGVQDALHHAATEAEKLYGSAREISGQTANRPMLEANPDSQSTTRLRAQLDALDKQQARLEAQTTRIEAYKTRNPSAWKSDDENLLLEVQISIRSTASTLADTRKELGKNHRWYLLGL